MYPKSKFILKPTECTTSIHFEHPNFFIVGHGVGIRFNIGFGYTYSHKMSVSIFVKTFKTMGIWNMVHFKMSTLRLRFSKLQGKLHLKFSSTTL